jgi:hypothetical protein
MTTSTTDFDFSSIDGALTPEQAALALSMAEGDTSVLLDKGGAPATTTAPTNEPPAEDKAKGTPDAGEAGATKGTPENNVELDDPSKAVVLARDGKHTIPYDTLVKHREGEQHWKAQAEAAQQQLAALQAEAQARAEAGQQPTKTDNLAAQAQAAVEAGADVSLFGDFSEEALAAGIQKLIDRQVAAQVEARVAEALKPLQAKQQQEAATEHYSAIYGKHPDADSIAQSLEFKAWVDAHPSAVRNAYWALFDPKTGGTANEIVEVFDAFKGASAPKPTTTAAADPKAAAKAATDAVRADPPSSLSSIPGGRVDGLSPDERMAELSGVDLLYAMEGKTPEQITAWRNKQM